MAAPHAPSIARRLEAAARSAAGAAYAPYSEFKVGAAVLAASGKIYPGCNVENASYSLCNCAERSAIFAAIAAGERRVEAVAIYTATPLPTLPCGACRQVINEFGPDALVISNCQSGERIETTLGTLLPAAFGPHDLKASRPRRARKAR